MQPVPLPADVLQAEPGPSRGGRVDIVYPILPPRLDGIGDYTAHFARALAEYRPVRILTEPGDFEPVPGVELQAAYSLERPQGIWSLVDAVAADPPEWLLLEFNQFTYGRWGLNPFLPLALAALKRRLPTLKLAWMAHENYVPVTSWKFAIMTVWQRWQFWRLGHLADAAFFSIDPWARKYRAWFPGKPVEHLPVGSNMPNLGLARASARARLGLAPEAFVAGVFGTINASRMVPLIGQAAQALHGRHGDVTVLYVGPHGDRLRPALGDVPMVDAGALPAAEVSRHLAAMDVHLAPFIDGVSTRRGSFMAGIQHGLPSVTTLGELSDEMLRAAAGTPFLAAEVDDPRRFVAHALTLLDDAALRRRMGAAAARYYADHFAFEQAAARFVEVIEQVDA